MKLFKIKDMRIFLSLLVVMIVFSTELNAQQFINKAVIEYELKTNIQKTMGNSSWDEKLKEMMPQFKTGYYLYTFADNKSIYKFDHWLPALKIPEWLRRNDEENIWYLDHDNNKFSMQKTVYGSSFITEDTIPVIKWKIINESRMIAGFNCRKAEGKISDSVYVFAYYTDEITIPGGPCSLNGLPGMILGVTIPRMYTSWIATTIMVNNVVVSDIKPVTSKKPFTLTAMKEIIRERTKDWVRADDPDSHKWMEQLLWNIIL
ncbi:MAG TPA: GLPGLI family protein [Ferruginibacter sp.]|nr:GLPGLI family protein [Ferruginibacter sp.]